MHDYVIEITMLYSIGNYIGLLGKVICNLQLVLQKIDFFYN